MKVRRASFHRDLRMVAGNCTVILGCTPGCAQWCDLKTEVVQLKRIGTSVGFVETPSIWSNIEKMPASEQYRNVVVRYG